MKMPKFGTDGRLIPETQTNNRIPPPPLVTCCPSDCSTNVSSTLCQESDRSPTYGPQHCHHAAVVANSEHLSGSEHKSRNEHASVDQDQSDTRAQVGTRGQEIPHHHRHSSRHPSPSMHVRMSGDEHSPETSGSACCRPRTSNEHILEFLASLEAKKQHCPPHPQPGGTSHARSPELENRIDGNKADEPSTVERSHGDTAKKSVSTQSRRSIRFDPVVTTYGGNFGPESGNISPPGSSAPVLTTPVPTASVPTVSVPTAPVPTTSVPTAPVPAAPVPTAPVPAAPVPAAPVPAASVPTAPVPTAPVPAASVPAAPVPTAPVQPHTLQLPMESMLDEYGDLLLRYH